MVSVIIPCHNGEDRIHYTLTSLSHQDYPKNRWEVVVVDNNSTDNSVRVVHSFKRLIPSMRVEWEPRQSSYAARNKGISLAHGEILAFIDVDMAVEPDWIRRGVNTILAGCDYVGCRIDIVPTHRPPNLWELYNVRTGFRIRDCVEQEGFAGAGNIFVRRKVFESVGLFEDRLLSGGDKEFGNRVKDAGFRLCYDHANRMTHPALSSLKSLWSKYVRTGEGHMDLRFFYPERYGRTKLRHVLSKFCPAFHLRRVLDARQVSDLSAVGKLGMLSVLNVVKCAFAYGHLLGYLQRRAGLRM